MSAVIRREGEFVEDICRAVGGYSALGRLLGISGWAVKKWILSNDIPADRVLALVDIAHQQLLPISPTDLRSDIYPKHLWGVYEQAT